MQCLHIVFLTAISFFLLSCNGSGGGSSSSDTGDGPALSAADKETVAPCPNQTILTDAVELAALKDALLTGALVFLDVPFDAGDPDNFKKKCGLEGFWDPARNTNEVTPASVGMTAITLSQLLTNGNAGICSTTSLPTNNIIGFPAAGTYRGEIKAAKGGSTWHLRMRVVASGTSAGKDFPGEGITVPGDIENTLEYKVNGTITPHDDLFTALVNAAATTGEAILFEVSKTVGGPVVFSMSIELICVTKS